MLLQSNTKEAETTIVLLNNKPVISYDKANDEEGWVDILDIEKLMETRTEKDNLCVVVNDDVLSEEDIDEWEEVPLKRLKGKVVFVKFMKT